ncbi:hypothetical protein [Massilia sp. CF038]|uniref:hypothetical protein n=1 Tax=Massilia sp. CF038 TaxID=1881045 RepID=UPI000918D415|nr:hypothetical protein [Massilia sp. CF038]SHH17435.1 hypothetical protein SAMN05428948_3151 [Massilia sp. CF038]
MKTKIPALRLPAAVTLAMTLAACGGGGGGSGGTTPNIVLTPPDSCSSQIQIVSDATVASGKVAGAAVLSCGAPLQSVVWSQVSGPQVALSAAETPTVAIETAGKVGTVRLKADVVLANGSPASATADIVIDAAPASSYITLRNDHSVRPGTDTSIRAWPYLAASGETVTNITWTQVAGPKVTMDTTDKSVLMFKSRDLADVPNDVALKFRATVTTSTGKTDSDDVIVSIDRQAATPNGYIFEHTARVHPYRKASAYAGVLAKCTYDVSLYFVSSTNHNLCPVSTLPLLSTEAGVGKDASIEQIMGRVLVSHDFLGANFQNFLENQDPAGDFRKLLGGVTAIVIGSHVRPSFYTVGTGAIYLDANNLWMTPEQRDVVTEVPDYRSSFGDSLNFTGLGRIVQNNDYVLESYPIYERDTRPITQVQVVLGRLMYHELAHANDFFSPNDRNLNGALPIYLNAIPRLDSLALPSDALAKAYPLTSPQMKRLGQILYLGKPAEPFEKAYTAAQVGAFFEADVANDDYAYSINGTDSSREDLAMLFEEFMVSYRYNFQYDVAYTNAFKDGDTAETLIVGWGQRGRIGAPGVKPRIKLVLQKIAPWIDPAEVDLLPAPIQMKVGKSWAANLNPATALSSSSVRPASFMTGTASKQQVRDDMANRRAAH